MITDTTQSKTEREVHFQLLLRKDFEQERQRIDRLYIVARRFRDCIYCLTRVEHPTTCKYILAAGESDETNTQTSP